MTRDTRVQDQHLARSGQRRPHRAAARREPVMLLRLTIRNQVYTTDFLGTHLGLVRPPAFTVAQQVERFIEANFQALQQVKLPD